MYDDNEIDEEEDNTADSSHGLPSIQETEFMIDHRTQQAVQAHPSGRANQQTHPPSLSSPESATTTSHSTSGAAKVHGTNGNDNMLQQYYSTGSWTVDLFSDPYMMGPLQFPNPFTTFPTSSMR